MQQGEPPERAGRPLWKSLIAPGKVDFWHKATAIYHFFKVTPEHEFIRMMCSDEPARWNSDPRRRECYDRTPCTLAKISLVKEGMPLDEMFERLSITSGAQGASTGLGTRVAEQVARRPPLSGRAQQLFALATGEPDDKERNKWQEGAPECVLHFYLEHAESFLQPLSTASSRASIAGGPSS